MGRGRFIGCVWFAAHRQPKRDLDQRRGNLLRRFTFCIRLYRTKQLWLSIGLHIGWNFFEGVVFGFPVSGLDIYPLLRIKVTGPELWTGGAFGPEAGLIVLPSLIVGAVLIYLFSKNRDGNI